MNITKPEMKMPELLVFVKSFVVGLVGSEVCRTTFYLGIGFAQELYTLSPWVNAVAILAGLAICLTYAVKRGALAATARIGSSFRLDLLIAIGLGVWSNKLALPWLTKFHAALEYADPHWAPVVLLLLCVVLLSPIFQLHLLRPKKTSSQLYFIADDEIRNEEDDLLGNKGQHLNPVLSHTCLFQHLNHFSAVHLQLFLRKPV